MILNILTAAVCFAMLLVFRQLDKNNRSIEKVKKFTDKVLADFDAYFKDRIIQMKNAGVELDVKQSQAVAAVKRLEQNSSAFEARSAEFGAHISVLDDIKKRVLSYEALIKDLFEMSSKVEENLEKIHKQSDFIDKTFKLLSDQQKRLGEIEKKIPQLLLDFEKQNAEYIGRAGVEYTAALDRRFADLETLADAATDKNQQLLEQINEVFEESLSLAAQKADSLEDDVFARLQENTRQRAEEFENLLNRSTQDLTEYIDREKTEIENDLAEQMKAVRNSAADVYERFKNDSDETLENLKNDLSAAVSEQREKVLSDLENQQEQVAAQLEKQREKVNELTGETERILAEAEGGQGEKIRSVLSEQENRFIEAVNDINEKTKTALEEVSNRVYTELSSRQEEVTASLAESRRLLDMIGNGQEEKIRAAIEGQDEKLSKALEKLTSSVAATYERFKNSSTEALESLKNDLSAAAAEQKAKVFSDLENQQQAVAAELEKQREKVNELAGETERILAEAEGGQGEKIRSVLSEQENRFIEAVNEINEKTRTALEEVSNRVYTELSSRQEEVTASLAESRRLLDMIGSGQEEKIRAAIEDQDERLQGAIGAQDEKFSKALEDLSSAAFSQFERRRKELADAAEKQYSALSDEIASLAEQSSAEIERQKKELVEFNTNFGRAEQMLQHMDETVNKRQQESTAAIEQLRRLLESDSASLAKESETHMAQMKDTFKTAYEDAVKHNAKTLQAFFGDTEAQLSDTKKDIEYRLKKLETLASDIDSLDGSFRKLMENAEQRILNEFDLFKNDRGSAQKDFESEINSSYEGMKEIIDGLDRELNELKTRAYDSVSEKLKVFEDDFFKDLNERGENLSTSLEEWKAGFDARLTDVSQRFEDERRSLELQYGEDLKEKLLTLQEKYRQQFGALEEALKNAEADFKDRIDGIDSSLRAFTDAQHEDMEKARQAVEESLKGELDRQQQNTAEQLKRYEQEINAQLTQISQSVAVAQEETKGSLEGILGDLASWRERLNAQFEENRSLYTEKLAGLQQASEEQIEQVRQIFTSDIAHFANIAKDETGKITADLDELKEQSKKALADYEERTEQVLEEFKKAYETMLDDTQRKIREENSDAEQKLRLLKTLVQDAQKKTESIHEKTFLEIQTEANHLKMSINETDRQLKQFLAQTQLVEKTTEMKNQLENQMKELRDHISRFDNFKQITDSIEMQFGKMRKIDDEITAKVQQFAAGKNKIDDMEKDFRQLMGLSSSMDQKILELKNTSDDLQILQGEVRRFQETLGDISVRYDRLEKKNIVLDQTIEGVDRTFDELRKLEQRLGECSQQTLEMPAAVDTLRADLDSLMEKSGRINDLVDKLNNLDSILAETDKRIEKVDTACSWITKTEVRLSEMKKEALEQVNLLGALVKDRGKKKDAGAPPIAVRESVIKLAHQGWKVEQIASSLNVTIGEVELILDFYGKETR